MYNPFLIEAIIKAFHDRGLLPKSFFSHSGVRPTSTTLGIGLLPLEVLLIVLLEERRSVSAVE